MKTFRNIFLITGVLFFIFSTSSCYRKKDTIAQVTVIEDSTSTAVSGAEVRLYYEGTPGADSARIDQTSTTDGSGIATFNFNDLYKSGQAGFAVLDIYVNGVIVSIIKIEEETTSEETVYI